MGGLREQGRGCISQFQSKELLWHRTGQDGGEEMAAVPAAAKQMGNPRGRLPSQAPVIVMQMNPKQKREGAAIYQATAWAAAQETQSRWEWHE